ncbi:hypothetical protein [Flavobacterium franklandianum]|uniref:Uncharacterized protein n=1 Tax=Flavobacterium franklandianum TaxID=2594430 RepID=A0A553CTL1_9FLAO|nr:hypothetical protein [Flavobacterium franklandianum]TRX23795.1 hypothetical protein FNW17_01060 [Flavobacterium franklandianum]
MIKYITFVILILPLLINNQTKIDNNVAVRFFGKTETINEVTKEAKLRAFYLNSNEDSYVAMRVETLVKSQLPESEKELWKNYKIIASFQIKAMAKKGLFFKDSIQIKFKNYNAYKLIFKEKKSEKDSAETLILYLNDITYIFIYSKVQSYDIKAKEKFFNSIEITNTENLKQIEEPYNYWVALVKIFLGGVFIFLTRKFLKIEKKRNLIK